MLNGFLSQLTDTKEEGQPLLDRTMVLYGTPMVGAYSNSNVNLPVLQRLGIKSDNFAGSKGTMKGLELA